MSIALLVGIDGDGKDKLVFIFVSAIFSGHADIHIHFIMLETVTHVIVKLIKLYI